VGGVNNMRRGDSPLVFTVRQTEARGHLTREREKKNYVLFSFPFWLPFPSHYHHLLP
jgi:hypothetical protein